MIGRPAPVPAKAKLVEFIVGDETVLSAQIPVAVPSSTCSKKCKEWSFMKDKSILASPRFEVETSRNSSSSSKVKFVDSQSRSEYNSWITWKELPEVD